MEELKSLELAGEYLTLDFIWSPLVSDISHYSQQQSKKKKDDKKNDVWTYAMMKSINRFSSLQKL